MGKVLDSRRAKVWFRRGWLNDDYEGPRVVVMFKGRIADNVKASSGSGTI
jgi:hypothetical protein